ncbi:glycosyltransferase family 2 protein [Clostridiaceae bacterium HSG29]|nr:glycosyltransferase family 2 protein [Clostridiaceae bacterium HSG29]
MIENFNDDTVIILLSTYNGKLYLRDQIESLLNQDYPHIEIFIRDDGSTDGTVEILNTLEEKYESINIIYGENIGVVSSFFELLMTAKSAKYYAFCDQDDVWLKDKISRATNIIIHKNSEKPILYGSSVTIVDQDLMIMRENAVKELVPSFNNALIQNIFTGCTIMINDEARKHLLKEVPLKLRMHDWWMYQVISGIGEVVYDSDSRILYRQHGNNAVGSYKNKVNLWVKRIKRFKSGSSLPFIMHHANELNRIFYNDLTKENQKMLNEFFDIRKNIAYRIRFVLTKKISRQNFFDDILFKILILFKKI